MKLVIMTKSTFFVEEDKILSALFEQGMDSLHLYKPGASPMYAERLLTLLPDDFYDKITVHEHFYLKQEYDLAGIHLDDASIKEPEGYKGRIGRSCSNIDQLKEMKRCSNHATARTGCRQRAYRQEGVCDGRHDARQHAHSQRPWFRRCGDKRRLVEQV